MRPAMRDSAQAERKPTFDSDSRTWCCSGSSHHLRLMTRSTRQVKRASCLRRRRYRERVRLRFILPSVILLLDTSPSWSAARRGSQRSFAQRSVAERQSLGVETEQRKRDVCGRARGGCRGDPRTTGLGASSVGGRRHDAGYPQYASVGKHHVVVTRTGWREIRDLNSKAQNVSQIEIDGHDLTQADRLIEDL